MFSSESAAEVPDGFPRFNVANTPALVPPNRVEKQCLTPIAASLAER